LSLSSVFAAARLGNDGIIMLLFDTPSGFAIFSFDGVALLLPDAIEVLGSSNFAADVLAPVSITIDLNVSCFSYSCRISGQTLAGSTGKTVLVPLLSF
jgi:hypothetical protein